METEREVRLTGPGSASEGAAWRVDRDDGGATMSGRARAALVSAFSSADAGARTLRRRLFELKPPAFDFTLADEALTSGLTPGGREIVAALKRRFPELPDPHKEDICYATTNRQEAVKQLADGSDLVLVIGSKNSSNSARLVEVAMRAGARDARLVDDASQVDWDWFDGVQTVGVTAGASAPEPLIAALVDAIAERFDGSKTPRSPNCSPDAQPGWRSHPIGRRHRPTADADRAQG